MSDQELPPDFSQCDLQAILEHYEGQSEDEQDAEIEAAIAAENITMMAVPTDRVPEIRALLARGASA